MIYPPPEGAVGFDEKDIIREITSGDLWQVLDTAGETVTLQAVSLEGMLFRVLGIYLGVVPSDIQNDFELFTRRLSDSTYYPN